MHLARFLMRRGWWPAAWSSQEQTEEDALFNASLIVHPASVSNARVSKQSRERVGEQDELFREALMLLAAAQHLARVEGPIEDVRRRAVLAVLAVQREMLWDGWKSVLEARYAAAIHHLRPLTQLADVVRAVAGPTTTPPCS